MSTCIDSKNNAQKVCPQIILKRPVSLLVKYARWHPAEFGGEEFGVGFLL